MRILDCCIDSFTQILYLPLRLKVRKLFQTRLDQIEKKKHRHCYRNTGTHHMHITKLSMFTKAVIVILLSNF